MMKKKIGKESFKKINISKYKEQKTVPTKTLQYYLDCIKKDEDPLIFFGVQHILLKDSLNINESKVIKYNSLT